MGLKAGQADRPPPGVGGSGSPPDSGGWGLPTGFVEFLLKVDFTGRGVDGPVGRLGTGQRFSQAKNCVTPLQPSAHRELSVPYSFSTDAPITEAVGHHVYRLITF